MSIGSDIKEVLEEIGIQYTIFPGGDLVNGISGEYGIDKINVLTTRPFFNEYVKTLMISYDSQLNNGDLIEISGENRYLIVSLNNFHVEGSTYKRIGTLYKANTSGEFRRRSTTMISGGVPLHSYAQREVSGGYVLSQAWETLLPYDAYSLLTTFSIEKLDEDAPEGAILERAYQLYTLSAYGIRELDQYVIGADKYVINAVHPYKYAGLVVCTVSVDQRE